MISSIVIVTAVLLGICVRNALCDVKIFTEWIKLNYTWDATHTYDEYIRENKFIPENCLLAGINVDETGTIYLTVPRWRNGVPATLNKWDKALNTLTPYPNWDMQIEGEPNSLQNVQSMNIDGKRRMWVIEVGRRNFFLRDSSQFVSGPAGLWIIDLQSDEILQKHYFPESVVTFDNSFLNDIVIDETRDIAYLSDAWDLGAIVVFDFNTGASRRYSGISTQADSSYAMIINGQFYGKNIFTTPTDGIALTEDNDALFYCQVQGTTLYRLPTAVLRNFSASNADIDGAVQVIGKKQPSDGMKYLNGVLYFGSLTTSTIFHVPITSTSFPDLSTAAVQEMPSVDNMHWVDSFAIDRRDHKTLWFTSNRLDQYSVYTMDFTGKTGSNMRIMSLEVA